MNIIPPKHFGKAEPSRSVMALVSGRHNPGADGHADADHYPILSRHWPNLSTPQTPCKSTPFRHGAFRAGAVPLTGLPGHPSARQRN